MSSTSCAVGLAIPSQVHTRLCSVSLGNPFHITNRSAMGRCFQRSAATVTHARARDRTWEELMLPKQIAASPEAFIPASVRVKHYAETRRASFPTADETNSSYETGLKIRRKQQRRLSWSLSVSTGAEPA